MMADDSHEHALPGAPLPLDAGQRDALVRALEARFDMSADDAGDVASTVLEHFGGQDELNDEALDPSVRSIFYTLEAKKLLSFRREEYRWENGELRRGFWWRLRLEEMEPTSSLTPDAREDDVYASLPADAWSGRQNA